jgi:hypothetical protein
MSSISPAPAVRWAGRLLTALIALFLGAGGAFNVVAPDAAGAALADLGYDPSVAPALGLVVVACVVLYVLSPTRVLGALLLTAYFGGAVATHVLLGDPAGVLLLPVAAAALVWAALLLSRPDLRSLVLPARRRTPAGEHSRPDRAGRSRAGRPVSPLVA